MTISLTSVGSGYSTGVINNNFQEIERYINEALLNRDESPSGQPNQMELTLDMNNNPIINIFTDVNNPNSLLQVGDADGRYINTSGDTMAGALNMGPHPLYAQEIFVNGLSITEFSTKGNFYVKTISDLRGLSDTPNSAMHVGGYYTEGDGGGGVYYKDSSSSSSDNGGSVIVDSGGDRWLLQVEDGYNVKQFGAKGDGVADDTSAIQTAINVAYSDNIKRVLVPYSDFGYIVSHNMDLLPGVMLKGADSLYLPNLYPAGAANDMSEFVKGHTFVVTSAEQSLDPATNELIRVRDGSAIIGINVVHRDQVETSPPDSYPPVIRLQPAGSNGFNIKECLFLNPYIGIDALGGHQNLDIENVYMEPMQYGVRMSEATQVDRITGLDIGGFWHRRNWSLVENDTNHVVNYIQGNAIGVELGRSDSYQMSKCLFFGVNIGIHFNGALGNAYGAISDSSFDANNFCIRSDGGSNSNGNLVSNCNLIPRSVAGTDITGVYINENSNVDAWEFVNCASWGGNAKRFMVVEEGKVRVTQVRVQDWDKNADAAFTFGGGLISMVNVDFAGLEGGAGNYISIPTTSTATVKVSALTWDGDSTSKFEVFDPNSVLQWVDDTNIRDRFIYPENYSTLQDAITDAVSLNTPLLLDSTTYSLTSKLTATLTQGNGLTIFGNGATLSGNFTGPLLEVTMSGELDSRLEMDGLILSNPSGNGIRFVGGASTGSPLNWGSVSNIYCSHGNINEYLLMVENFRHINFRDCTGKANTGKTGGLLVRGDGMFAGDLNFHGCEFAGGGGFPVAISAKNTGGEARGIHFTDCYFYEGNSLIEGVDGALAADIYFTSCQWDEFNTHGKGIDIYANATGSIDNIGFTQPYFQQGQFEAIGASCDPGGSISNITINCGHFGGITGVGRVLNFYDVRDVSIIGPIFQSCNTNLEYIRLNDNNNDRAFYMVNSCTIKDHSGGAILAVKADSGQILTSVGNSFPGLAYEASGVVRVNEFANIIN